MGLPHPGASAPCSRERGLQFASRPRGVASSMGLGAAVPPLNFIFKLKTQPIHGKFRYDKISFYGKSLRCA
jgi:hypothetical protein